MTETGPLLDRAAIQGAFRRLGDRLVARGVVADIYVIGGAAMAMAYDAHMWLVEVTRQPPHVFDHPGLRVSAASPEHLLAMKVLAGRRRDAEDIAYLVKHLDLSSSEDALAVCERVFPDELVPDRAKLILEDLFDEG